jgi:hypothetical protein
VKAKLTRFLDEIFSFSGNGSHGPFGIDVILYIDNYYTELEPENQHNKGTCVCRQRESTNKIMYVQFEDKREVGVLTT